MSALAAAALHLRIEKPETLIRDRVVGAIRDAIAWAMLATWNEESGKFSAV